eukprot:TRINITY_DN12806_c0_g1_i1.p1 TRINITY_DN12806_c0_g1~~TRINITY_DN12806_c0_g1_i1.p1  ORF type:complete len:284 (+),score=46.97 TRINITY_DN12806_c0_g1_i1:148-999(+)
MRWFSTRRVLKVGLLCSLLVPATYFYQQMGLYDLLYNSRTLGVYGRVRTMLIKAAILKRTDFRASKITDRLWLGDLYDAHNVESLRALDIRHILTVVIGVRPSYPTQFQYKQIEVLDTVHQDIQQHFNATNEWLDAILDDKDAGGVLVHCMQGKSRSASVVAAYLMHKNGWSADEALEYVKKARPIVNPNTFFRQQLGTYIPTPRVLGQPATPAAAAEMAKASAPSQLPTESVVVAPGEAPQVHTTHVIADVNDTIPSSAGEMASAVPVAAVAKEVPTDSAKQ